MEEFRELVLLLKNYSADEHIEVFDSTSIKQVSLWKEQGLENEDYDVGFSMRNRTVMNGGNQDSAAPRQRLWNTLLFLDLTQEDTYNPQRVAYLCWQRLAVLKTLMAAGAIKSLRDIAESLLQTAKAYELTTIVIETAAQLRQFCALHDGNMSGFEQYCRLIDQYEKVLEAERVADDEYCTFLFQQNDPRSTAASLAREAKEACQRLQPYALFCTSTTFVLNYYFLQLQAAFLVADWEAVVQISSQATQLLSHKTVSIPAKISAFSLSKALGRANLGYLNRALEALAGAINEESVGSLNWYRLQEMKINWLLHQGKYSAALTLTKVLNQKNKYQEWSQEQKRLYNSVFLILEDLGLLSISNRVKGMLIANCLPFRNLYLPELSSPNIDAQAALLLMQLPKWIEHRLSGQLASWLAQYLELSGAAEPQSLRLETLITCLQDIEAGQLPRDAAKRCINRLKNLPLDYTSPEAAIEILNIEKLLNKLLGMH